VTTWTPERLEALYAHLAKAAGDCVCPLDGPCYSPTALDYTWCALCLDWPVVAACPKSRDGIRPAMSP
jgi:hypothetical protein